MAEQRVREWRRKQRLSREDEERRAAQLLEELHERRQACVALSEGILPSLGGVKSSGDDIYLPNFESHRRGIEWGHHLYYIYRVTSAQRSLLFFKITRYQASTRN